MFISAYKHIFHNINLTFLLYFFFLSETSSSKFSELSKFLHACYYLNNLVSVTLFNLQKFKNKFCTDKSPCKNTSLYTLPLFCLLFVEGCSASLSLDVIYMETRLDQPLMLALFDQYLSIKFFL